VGKAVGLKAPQPEEKPDITAIASHPLAPFGGAGTSFSSPLMAGAYVVLEQDVLAHHLRAIGSFNPTLYRVFADQAVRSGVFNDVVHGTTDLLHLGCCKARPGFDEASGLGSVPRLGADRTSVAGGAMDADQPCRVGPPHPVSPR
jgi:hypothetical protein